MARLTQQILIPNKWTVVRTITGAPVAADPIGTAPNLFVDASYPIAGALDCTGWETALFGLEIVAGTSPTGTLEMLFGDPDAATDGQRWKRILQGALPGVTVGAQAAQTSQALTNGGPPQELRVLGCAFVFPRLSAVGGTAGTTYRILAMPGYPMLSNPIGGRRG